MPLMQDQSASEGVFGCWRGARVMPEPLRAQLPARCVLDGEIVVAQNGGLDFEALQLRIHPAASRVTLLSQQIPASIVFFDLLCEGKRDLRGAPFQVVGTIA